MNRAKIFRLVSSGRFAAPIAVALFGFLLTATAAKAGCGAPMGPAAFPLLNPQENTWSNPSDNENSGPPGSIVGLWHVVYTATYSTPGPLPVPIVPPGSFQLVQSYKTWHSDGTEMDNAFLPPAGGNVCFGVWKQLGNGSVKEHHVGLMFALDGSLANIFTEDEVDRVSHDGKTYNGTFDQKIFDPTDVFGTGTPVQEIKGTTAATRITVD